MTEKQEYEKELLDFLELQKDIDSSAAIYLVDLFSRLSWYAPLEKKTIKKAKEIVERNKVFAQEDYREMFGEDLEELFLNKKKD